MKKILLLILCLVIVRIADAQKNLLSMNEHNQYLYYKVVDMPAVSTDSLHKNAVSFVNVSYPKNESIGLTDSSVVVKDKFLVYGSNALSKREIGQMNYTLNIEVKNSKYRYWLTDFVYLPYQRDRYGAFVPVNGIDIALENAAAKLDKKDLASCMDQTGTFCKQLGDKLQKYVAENHAQKQPAQPSSVKKVATDKW